jgi:hypothetical protein
VHMQSHKWTRIPSVCTLMSKFVATCEVKVGFMMCRARRLDAHQYVDE